MPASNRREFLKTSLVVLGSAVAAETAGQTTRTTGATESVPALTPDHQVVHVHGSVATTTSEPEAPEVPPDTARHGIPNRKWIMVIDLAKCDGCGHCIAGCSKMHFIPADRQWIKVLRMRDSRYAAPYFFPQPCFHCDNPPCTKVCPVDATYKRSDGLVLVDNERCIGCRFCIAGCPYTVRTFNWGKPPDPPEALAQNYSPEHGFPRRIGTVEKCDFCADMARIGKLPGCASVCPMGVIYFGDEYEDAVTNGLGETVRLKELLGSNAAYRHLEELGTEPRCYYLPPKNRMYPAPPRAQQEEAL